MDNSIVIIGGMGPQASLELHRLLIDKISLTAKNPDDYPNILHASLSIPDFIADDAETPLAVQAINNACNDLPLGNARAIGMACNTAHLLLPSLPSLNGHHFVSMIDAVCDRISASGYKTIGLLASPFTLQSNLYATPLTHSGHSVLVPPISEMPKMASIIRDVISGKNPKDVKKRLTLLARELENRGADCILLGCTELPLIGIDSTLPTFSSLDALAIALLKQYDQGKML